MSISACVVSSGHKAMTSGLRGLNPGPPSTGTKSQTHPGAPKAAGARPPGSTLLCFGSQGQRPTPAPKGKVARVSEEAGEAQALLLRVPPPRPPISNQPAPAPSPRPPSLPPIHVSVPLHGKSSQKSCPYVLILIFHLLFFSNVDQIKVTHTPKKKKNEEIQNGRLQPHLPYFHLACFLRCLPSISKLHILLLPRFSKP